MKKLDVYMPLLIGDWLKGTRGMKAEVRGVYLNLLLYQWDNGFIPEDMESLKLIEPEVEKAWHIIKEKFEQVAPGKLQNRKNEEVRDFFSKQKGNGKKGGRPKNPKGNPKHNPNSNPNHNLHNECELELESDPKNALMGVVGGVPSQAQIEEAFTQYGLMAKDGAEFYSWVKGRYGWESIHSWTDYVAATISKKLEEKKGKNGQQKFGAKINLTDLEQSTNDFLKQHHRG